MNTDIIFCIIIHNKNSILHLYDIWIKEFHNKATIIIT